MIFNSLEFLVFFPIVVFTYYILPKKIRYIWLLAASYYFYMQSNAIYVCLLFSCTLVTYVGGRILESLQVRENDNTEKRRKLCLSMCIIINLGILGFFKYCDFAIETLNDILSFFGLNIISWETDILLPVGISFYTIQALGYLIDVYRGDIYAEKNFLRYALFISFFPQLVAGPIERSKNLLVQLYKTPKFVWENCRSGMVLILWGLFLKIVIADRAAIVVNTVYDDSATYQGGLIVIATLLFSIQIYCDFYGYSVIAKGVARVFGIELMDNFNAPYFSMSVKEFWRRWHISLSGWFRDYLYIPLGGNKKGRLRKQINLLTVFAISGLWHGASGAFIIWGVLNGLYQTIGEGLNHIKGKISNYINLEDTFSRRLIKRLLTFGMVSFAWIFFRAGNMTTAIEVIKNMCHFNIRVLFDGTIYQLGVVKEHFHCLIGFIAILGYIDYQKYKGRDMVTVLLKQEIWLRILVFVTLLFVILLFGCYGVEYDTNQFIYFQF